MNGTRPGASVDRIVARLLCGKPAAAGSAEGYNSRLAAKAHCVFGREVTEIGERGHRGHRGYFTQSPQRTGASLMNHVNHLIHVIREDSARRWVPRYARAWIERRIGSQAPD